jgi:acetyl esterase/lipase
MSFRERADPAIVPILDLVPPIDLTGDIPEARTVIDAIRRELLAGLPDIPEVVTRDVEVPGLAGDPDVLVRIYEPADGRHSGGALSYIHGGGMVLMSVDDTDFHCKRIVRDVGCLVTSVDYRLAPEHPYPAALHDCYAALRWLHDHAGDLGVDPERIGVGGLSAGGGLAAGVSILARDRGEVPVCFQWLVYPMLDDRNETPSSHEIADPNVWNRASNVRAWEAYLGDLAGGDEVPLPAAPARAGVDDLRGLPPAYVDVGEADVFRDEDIAYAQALLQAGVPTELHVTPGAFHASEMYGPDADSSQRIERYRTEALRRALG